MNNTLNKNISILGCGWLGLALAESFVKKGYQVKGSVMHEEHLQSVTNIGAKAYKIAFTPELNTDANKSFFESDILISCIPPKRQADIADYYPLQIEQLAQQAKSGGIKNILFISSTSVYPNTKTKVTEDEKSLPQKASGLALIASEKLLLTNSSFNTTVLRFGGLIGYDRHPGRFLSGKKNLKNGEVPVNLIHRDDCIGIIHEILKQNTWQEVFNACSPEHPSRKEFYTLAAQKANLPKPEFSSTSDEDYKLVDPSRLIQKLQYTFKYKSPLETI